MWKNQTCFCVVNFSSRHSIFLAKVLCTIQTNKQYNIVTTVCTYVPVRSRVLGVRVSYSQRLDYIIIISSLNTNNSIIILIMSFNFYMIFIPLYLPHWLTLTLCNYFCFFENSLTCTDEKMLYIRR